MILLYSIIGIILLIILISYLIHIIMSQDDSYPKAWGTFKDFIYQFNKYDDWECDNNYFNSLFTKTRNCEDYSPKGYIHCSIIRFNGYGMLMKNPYEWFKFVIWNTNYCMNKNRIKKIDWSQV